MKTPRERPGDISREEYEQSEAAVSLCLPLT